ncbi:hypothetical protein IV203_005271 [Nitzschia inconspicua]|uniref:Sulfotransferase n=1 Tax=Nitzschia inconspicua TaxID=303405 RepID=A0A9K3KNL5_9STRA|nr:hypothetical protein IV203_005271 [Nitzschia inconspicua]
MTETTPRRHEVPQRRLTLPPRKSSSNTAGFVHMGKTGGSTISSLLQNGCNSLSGSCERSTNLTDSPVSKWVEHYYHVPDFWRLPQANHRSFIVSIRDPYDRTVSALLYHHPENAKFYQLQQTTRQQKLGPLAYQCFPTLEAFASLLQRGNSTDCNYPYRHNVIEPSDCSELACATIHGKVRFFTHLFFNYRNIVETKLLLSENNGNIIITDKQRQIYVLRQEHLWEDWTTLNQLVATADDDKSNWQETTVNNEANKFQSHRNITGLNVPVTREISQQGRHKLCLALETEYIAYFRLLQVAINMNDNDVADCQRIARQNCPNLNFSVMLRTKKS